MKHVMLFAGLACVGATISTPPIAWTIAGSDAGGGAGIQADLAAFRALGVHGCSAITALTAQNSVEVRMVEYPSIEMLRTTLAALRDDLPAGAIKIGMTGREWVIREVADFLTSYKGPVVCDPVMVSTSGRRLLDADASAALISKLFPRCALITPNLPEAEALLGRKLRTPAEVEEAAAALLGMGCGAVLIKGGHMHEAEVCSTEPAADGARSGSGLGDHGGGEGGSGGEGSGGEGSGGKGSGGEGRGALAQDYYSDGTTHCWLSSARLPTRHTHGTGCTLAAATAALLARGLPMLDAVVLGKAYVTQGIAAAGPLGAGPGPVAHTGWPSQSGAMPWLSTSAHLGAHPPRFPRCDPSELRGILPVVESVALVAEVVAAGARHVQLRLKDLAEAEIGVAVAAAQAVCAQHGARLWVNDHWRAAVAHGAYGVHVGQEDLAAMGAPSVAALAASGLRLGVSTHSYAELATALGVRPSYISLGPIYATASKDVSKWGEQGLERIASWRRLVPAHVPLIAIGGISIERAPGVLAAGAEGIAVISAITKAADRAAAVREWQALWG